MSEYHNEMYGNQHLTLHEILDAVDQANLLDQMSIEELQYLSSQSSSLGTKSIFLQKAKSKQC